MHGLVRQHDVFVQLEFEDVLRLFNRDQTQEGDGPSALDSSMATAASAAGPSSSAAASSSAVATAAAAAGMRSFWGVGTRSAPAGSTSRPSSAAGSAGPAQAGPHAGFPVVLMG